MPLLYCQNRNQSHPSHLHFLRADSTKSKCQGRITSAVVSTFIGIFGIAVVEEIKTVLIDKTSKHGSHFLSFVVPTFYHTFGKMSIGKLHKNCVEKIAKMPKEMKFWSLLPRATSSNKMPPRGLPLGGLSSIFNSQPSGFEPVYSTY